MKEHALTGAAGFYRRWNGIFFGLLALVIVLCTLFGGDEIGLSNNGDFNRVMRACSLSYGEQLPNQTYAGVYAIDVDPGFGLGGNLASVLFSSCGLEVYPSLHLAVVRLSVAAQLVINRLMTREPGVYHLRTLGCMYAALYALAIGLLCARVRLRRLWADVPVKLIGLVMLCDIGYTAYFNSFYSEPLEHIMLIFCAAALLRVLGQERPSVRVSVWCALAAVGYGWAKFFNIPLAILLTAVMTGAMLLRGSRRRVLLTGGVAIAVLLAVWSAVPDWMDIETNYNSTFFGILRGQDEDAARRSLADLGLPEELSDYRDTNYYMDGLLSSLEERGLRTAAESVTKKDLLCFYLSHPRRLWQQVRITALHCGMIRPYYLANYGGDCPKMTYSSRMSLWSTARDWLALDTVWGNAALVAAFVGLAVTAWHRKVKPLRLTLALLTLLGGMAYAFLLPVILNGEGDIAKHMFAYIEIADLVLLACLALALDGDATGHLPLLRPAIAGVLALALVVPPLAGQISALLRASITHSRPESGSYVLLGSFHDRPLTWLITEAEDGILTLLCLDRGIELPFDEQGDNDWRDSSIREWLNTDFLEGFTTDERALLQDRSHSLLLSNRYVDQAEAGEVFFSCEHIAVLAARDMPRAYRLAMQDMVSLPSIALAAELAETGYSPLRNCWLETPYCPSGDMVRCVGGDGHIYFAPADVTCGVRPIVTIAITEPISGNGSMKSPFILSVN